MRLFHQGALRQIFQSRPMQTRQAVRQLSSHSSISQQQCLRTQQRSSPTLRNGYRSHSRTLFSPSRLSKPSRRFQSTTSGPTLAPEETPSLSQRMRKLSREYGYAAVGVYIALSTLDLPFCYLAVSYLGTERIGRWEHAILSYIKGILKWPMGEEGKQMVDEGADYVKRKVPLKKAQGEGVVGKRLLEEDETYVVEDHGYTEAEKADQGDQAGTFSLFGPLAPIFLPTTGYC